MDLKFRVAARIAKPVHEVFEAVADPSSFAIFNHGDELRAARKPRYRDVGFPRLPAALPSRWSRSGPTKRSFFDVAASDASPQSA